jgi:hypothetical protein
MKMMKTPTPNETPTEDERKQSPSRYADDGPNYEADEEPESTS